MYVFSFFVYLKFSPSSHQRKYFNGEKFSVCTVDVMAEIFSSTVVDVLFDASMYSDRIWFLSSLSYDRFNVRLFSQELVL